MWYRNYRIILASLQDEIQNMTPEQQEFVGRIQDTQALGMIVNIIKKRPEITIPELRDIVEMRLIRQTPPLNTPQEEAVASAYADNPQFQNWVLLQLRKLRRTLVKTGNQEQFNYNIELRQMYGMFSYIYDWFRFNEIPDIASYSLDKAKEASDEWHKVIVGEGEGKVYEPTNESLIVFDFSNIPGKEEWNGWTMQEIISPNDLSCEGKLMNHCVGSYARNVQYGDSRIFSLRDPQNRPHVTIETDNDGTGVKQIKGNSNYDPKEEYKEMIRYWVANHEETMLSKMDDEQYDEYYTSHYDSEYVYSIDDAEELGSYLASSFWIQDHPEEEQKPENYEEEYGLKVEYNEPDYETLTISTAYDDCIYLLKKYIKWSKDPNEPSWRKKKSEDYINAIEVLSENLIDAAYQHDTIELNEKIKEERNIPYVTWKNYSFLMDLKSIAKDKIVENLYEEDVDIEENKLQSMTHQLAQNQAIDYIGTQIDINNSNMYIINQAIDKYWQKKLEINPADYLDKTGKLDRIKYLRTMQELYNKYISELEDDVYLNLKIRSQEDGLVDYDPEIDFGIEILKQIEPKIQELNDLVLHVTKQPIEKTSWSEIFPQEKSTQLQLIATTKTNLRK